MLRKLTLAAVSLLLIAASPVRLETPQGSVEGQGEAGVETFKGLPYAAPPVGELRWRAPQAAPVWSTLRAADSFGENCVQTIPAAYRNPKPLAQSEDCLTLNVWRPTVAKNAPVMVWIHGGSNTFGSGAEPFYDGTAFAKRGIVLVTINYRLGYLGFFGHPALKDGGGNLINYGLLDQIAALRWVKSNIAAYGGDPAKVTIFGESAGGSAVLNLLAAPSARDLFARAIVQSGGGLVTNKDAASSTQTGKTVAAALGFKGDAATADALRAVPAARFLDAAIPRPEPGFGAVPGGAELSEPPLKAIRAGRGANVPLIIGVNSNEGSLVDSWGIRGEQVLSLLGGRLPVIADAYGTETTDTEGYARRLYGDAIFAYPARAVARAQSKRAPVWLYYFDYVPDQLRPQRKAVNHAAEIPFVFDVAATPLVTRTTKDSAYAAGVNSCFAAFAKSAKPSEAPFCASWQTYGAERDNWFVFRDRPAEATGLSKRRLDAIGGVLAKVGLD